MLGKRLALGVSISLLGCSASLADRCRAGAVLQPDSYVRELQLNRCEALANREFIEQLRRDERTREADRDRAREEAQVEAEGARGRQEFEAVKRAARAAPQFPELGATLAESNALCEKQGGSHSAKPALSEAGTQQICRVGGAIIYATHLPKNAESFDAVKVFYDGADVTRVRGALEHKFGEADTLEVENGFRVWRWERTKPRILLKVYAQGVSVTFRLAASEKATAFTDSESLREAR